jgi:hypothetical protein
LCLELFINTFAFLVESKKDWAKSVAKWQLLLQVSHLQIDMLVYAAIVTSSTKQLNLIVAGLAMPHHFVRIVVKAAILLNIFYITFLGSKFIGLRFWDKWCLRMLYQSPYLDTPSFHLS